MARQRRSGASVPLSKFLAEDIPPPTPLLGSWLCREHLTMVYAPAGVGKTMFSLSAALAVAGGGMFLGWKAATPQPVLYVDGEMSKWSLQDRLKMLSGAVKQFDREAAGDHFHLVARSLGGEVPDLASSKGREWLLEEARRVDAALVVLDNLSTLVTLEDENAASSFDGVIQTLLTLRSDDRAAMLVHHARKGGDSYRGSSKLEGPLDCVVSLRHSSGRPSINGARFDLSWTKVRELRDGTMQPLRAELRDVGGGKRAWIVNATNEDRVSEMIEYLKSGQYGTQGELAEALGVAGGTLSGWKKEAIEQGRITSRQWKQCLKDAGEGTQGGDF
ncbi:AAA family ATPase [Planctomycetales bacterium ZRK34]|nr:AAA family ATPase [Planctomycetales bacterium ZRK34]